MPWFQKLCRQTGLALHGVMRPANKAEVRRTVEEKQVNEHITLRRTTIEEIELKPSKQDDHAAR